ncbi:MAG: HXXEE domain-containing protein [Acidobacteriota bacterium]
MASGSNPVDPARRHATAWAALVATLAVHVVDEAATGFLDFYNPLVEQLRETLGWLLMPAFTFPVWLTGLVMLVLALAVLTPAVRRGAPGTRTLSWAFAAIMLGNGVAHLAGSVYFSRWLPGATSAPLLLVASLRLVAALTARRRAGLHRPTPSA